MGHVTGSRNTGGEAFVEWNDEVAQHGVAPYRR
jgi:hypothetical protein